MVIFLKPSEGRITSHFQPNRLNPVTKKWKAHKGIDYGKDGSPDITAAADGIVRRVATDGRIGYTGGSFGGFGNVIIITHSIGGQQYETLYAHLKSVSVKVGQKVQQGQKIGVRGHTGNSTGEHLHFEIHKPSYLPGQPNALDPYPLVYDKDVKAVQEILGRLGFTIKADGIMGESTAKAVAIFQQSKGLEADGVAGANTWKALTQALQQTGGVDNMADERKVIPLTDNQKEDRAKLAEYGIMSKNYEFTQGYEVFNANLMAQLVRKLEEKGVLKP